MRESDVIERLRRIATTPEARGLLDDVALLDGLVITHDSMAEGVHFLAARSAGQRRVEAGCGQSFRPCSKGRNARGSLAVADDLRAGKLGRAIPERRRSGMRKLRPSAHRRRYDCAPRRGTARPRIDRDRPCGRSSPPSLGRQTGRRPLARRNGRRCRGRPRTACSPIAHATGPLVDIYRRPVPQLGAGQALAPHGERDDGCFRRPAARRAANGGGEPLRDDHRARPAAAVQRVRRRTGPGPCRAGCSPQPAATIMRCSPRCPPTSIRQRFLYQGGRGSAASARWPQAGLPFLSPAAASQSSCRRGLDLSMRAANLTATIGDSRSASG